MGKKIYIDGNLLVHGCVFYGFDFCSFADETFKETADEIIRCNEDEIYEVTEDNGSMFNEYYVKGEITMYYEDNENDTNIYSFFYEHKHTYDKYKVIQNQIMQLLNEARIPKECINYFYQQQYISLFANLEYFLYNTFMWETCQSYESYHKVLPILEKYARNKDTKVILKREHCILQEITFVEQTKYATYHNATLVGKLYKSAFNIDVDLNILNNELEIRHDIVHRAGYTKEGTPIQVTKENVMALNERIDSIIDYISLKIKEYKAE